jgi:hypothetical protein
LNFTKRKFSVLFIGSAFIYFGQEERSMEAASTQPRDYTLGA